MKVAIGESIEDLWLNLLVSLICDKDNYYFHPEIITRYIFAETNHFEFKNTSLISDFYKYSGYNRQMKMGQLRKEYWTGKVEKQFKVLKDFFRQLSPRQARAAVYFSEPAFDTSSKLKCLESLYLFKTSKTEYEAFLTFRNTEIYPKLFMDFIYVKELLHEIDRDLGVKCIGFRAIIINAFLRLHQVMLVKMFASEWGITNYSDNFKKMINEFERKYQPESIQTLKLISMKRVLERTYRLKEVA